MDSLHRNLFLVALVVFGVTCRFLFSGLPNFAPVGALALFAGASFTDKRIALVLPLVVMLLTDWMIGMHSSILFVYFGMVLYVAFGSWAGDRLQLSRLIPATLLGSICFFIVTNLGSFFAFYPTTWQGLLDCYAMALPFFRNTLAGDFFFGAILFGSLAIAQKFAPSLRPALEHSR